MASTEFSVMPRLKILCLCLFSIMTDFSLARAEQTKILRLDPQIVPLRYNLDFIVDPASSAFRGDAKIEISLSSPTNRIVIHGLDLKFDAIEIKAQNSQQNVTATELAKDGTLALDFPNQIPAGNAQLYFRYHAVFSNGLEGLYKVSEEGENSVFTQFQAIGARRAFPCFDEPGFKAVFDVAITSPENYKVISNTREVAVTKIDGKLLKHHYAITKPLPTYLVALAVGNFDVVTHTPVASSKLRKNPIPLRGIAMRGRGEELKIALDVTAKLLLAEENYFGIAYPFDKLDIIAVPDFGAGGMENAGAITYDENLVLLGDDATLQRRREFLTTHAHEIAHQWFGNLVTPKWWDDLWLNESFASLMESKFARQIEPDWRFETDIQRNAHEAMVLDGASSVRRIHEPVTTIDGITGAFDAITYQKGAAVLAMVEATLGETKFQKFVDLFLKTHEFAAIDSQDFIKALKSEKNGSQAAAILTSYIENPGLPVLTIPADKTSTEVMQTRFLSNDTSLVSGWTLPGSAKELFKSKVAGYYIFNLSPADWVRTLADLPKMTRAQALRVAINFDLAFVEHRISIQDYFNGVVSIAKHSDWEVAGFPLERLEFIESESAKDSKIEYSVQLLLRELYSPMLAKIGVTKSLESKDVQTWMLELQREHLAEIFAVSSADEKLKAQLTKLGMALITKEDDALDENDSVPADVVEAALIAALEKGGDTVLNESIARFKSSDDGHDREIWLHAIAASHAKDSSAAIESLLLSDDLRNHEVATLLFARAAIPVYRDDTWTIVDRNTQRLLTRLNGDLEITLIQIADYFASEDLAQRVEATISPLLGRLRGGAVQLNQTLERIRLNAAIVSRFEQ
jgi:cytosol alanyl aminopeptidase